MKRRRLILRSETVAVLAGPLLTHVRGGRDVSNPSQVPHPCEDADTDGGNGCVSEATSCHTGWPRCGTC